MTQTAPATSAVAYASAASAPRAGVGLEPDVTGFYDEATGSVQYVVADPMTRRCAVIDPVLDFDPTSGATRTTSADRLLRHIEANRLTLDWILDTHPHADHFSAAGYLKDVTGAPTAIGERVIEVQRIWKKLYNLPDTFPTDGSQWDHLFADGERFAVGAIEARALLSPGHTLCSMTYLTATRPSCTTPCSCQIQEPRAPIFPEATRLRSGGAFNGFSSCPTTRACLPAMTIVQAVGKRAGKAPSLGRRRTISI